MSSIDPEYVQTLPPSPSRKTVEEGGYRASFYPGFVRALAVDDAGKETVLYEQPADEPFVLPAGAVKPWPTSTFTLAGGPNARELRLDIHDPKQEIASIVVTFKAPGGGDREYAGGDGERVLIQDGPVLCPPMCPPIGPIGPT